MGPQVGQQFNNEMWKNAFQTFGTGVNTQGEFNGGGDHTLNKKETNAVSAFLQFQAADINGDGIIGDKEKEGYQGTFNSLNEVTSGKNGKFLNKAFSDGFGLDLQNGQKLQMQSEKGADTNNDGDQNDFQMAFLNGDKKETMTLNKGNNGAMQSFQFGNATGSREVMTSNGLEIQRDADGNKTSETLVDDKGIKTVTAFDIETGKKKGLSKYNDKNELTEKQYEHAEYGTVTEKYDGDNRTVSYNDGGHKKEVSYANTAVGEVATGMDSTWTDPKTGKKTTTHFAGSTAQTSQGTFHQFDPTGKTVSYKKDNGNRVVEEYKRDENNEDVMTNYGESFGDIKKDESASVSFNEKGERTEKYNTGDYDIEIKGGKTIIKKDGEVVKDGKIENLPEGVQASFNKLQEKANKVSLPDGLQASEVDNELDKKLEQRQAKRKQLLKENPGKKIAEQTEDTEIYEISAAKDKKGIEAAKEKGETKKLSTKQMKQLNELGLLEIKTEENGTGVNVVTKDDKIKALTEEEIAAMPEGQQQLVKEVKNVVSGLKADGTDADEVTGTEPKKKLASPANGTKKKTPAEEVKNTPEVNEDAEIDETKSAAETKKEEKKEEKNPFAEMMKDPEKMMLMMTVMMSMMQMMGSMGGMGAGAGAGYPFGAQTGGAAPVKKVFGRAWSADTGFFGHKKENSEFKQERLRNKITKYEEKGYSGKKYKKAQEALAKEENRYQQRYGS